MKKLIRQGIAPIFALVSLIIAESACAQSFILDSGTPSGTSFPILNNSTWFAAEFSATAGQNVTQLSAYLTSMTGNGNNFAFDIYTDGGGAFLSTRNSSLSQLLAFSVNGTYSGPGWSSSSVSWTVPTTGNYWLAIEGNTAGTHNLPTFDAQTETSATTGTAPALAFATDTGTQFKTSGASAIGLEVTVAPVPEPATWGLIALAGLSILALRRKPSSKPAV